LPFLFVLSQLANTSMANSRDKYFMMNLFRLL